MNALRDRVLVTFDDVFGGLPALITRAPARVNLVGDHADYDDGFVSPCAIDCQTLVAIRPRDDDRLSVVACDHGCELVQMRLDLPLGPAAGAAWSNDVRGVVKMLQDRGIAVQGADIAIAGDFPGGSGLSSSAPLELAVLQAFNVTQGLGLSSTELALLAQRAENDFVGCRCGILDQ